MARTSKKSSEPRPFLVALGSFLAMVVMVSMIGVAFMTLLQGCGPLAIGAAASGGGGGGGGRTPSTVNFTETEPNETGPAANVVGPIFPSRTYIITGSHPGGADFDFFRIDATEPVRVQMTLTPNAGADLVLLVGSAVDNGGPGAPEMFVVDMMQGTGFAAGSTEFSGGVANYTLRLQGQGIPGAPDGTQDPPVIETSTVYIELDARGQVISRTEISDDGTGKP